MPAPATAMAHQVWRLWRCDQISRDNKAVSKGPAARVTKTLAVGVSVSASMKAVNITLQQAPDTQVARSFQRIWRQYLGPFHRVSKTNRLMRVKALRQKVTSKPLA